MTARTLGVEGTKLVYMDASNVKRELTGTDVGAGVNLRSVGISGTKLRYVDALGDLRELEGAAGVAGANLRSIGISGADLVYVDEAGTIRTLAGTGGPPGAFTISVTSNVLAGVTTERTASAGADTYDVHRSTVAGFAPDAGNRIATDITATSYTDDPGTGQIFYYKWVAKSAGGTTTSNEVSADRRLPATPAAPVSVAVGFEVISVDWATAARATSHDLLYQYSTDGGATWGATSTIAGVTADPYPFPFDRFHDGRLYRFWVRANNEFGSTTGSATNADATIDAPAAPTGFGAVSSGAGDAVTGSWGWHNPLPDAGITFELNVGGNTTEVTDGDATIGALAVNTEFAGCSARARNSHCWGPPSNTDTGWTKPSAGSCSAVADDHDSVTITVSLTGSVAAQATVYRMAGASPAPGTDPVVGTTGHGLTVQDTGLSASTTYTYYQVAQNPDAAGIDSDTSATSSATTAAAPLNPTITAASVTATALKDQHSGNWTQADCKSVKIEYELNDGPDGTGLSAGYTAHPDSPSEADVDGSYSTTTVTSNAYNGGSVRYKFTPYSGDALGGAVGTPVETGWSNL